MKNKHLENIFRILSIISASILITGSIFNLLGITSSDLTYIFLGFIYTMMMTEFLEIKRKLKIK